MASVQISSPADHVLRGPTLLAARGIGKRTQDSGQWLVRHVDWDIRGGDIWAVTGLSGSGKSVLLRLMSSLIEPDEGTLWWHDHTVRAAQMPAFRAAIGWVSQRPILTSGSMWDNLHVPLTFTQHHGRAFDREQIRQWLRQLGRDDDLLLRSRDQVSVGEAQCICLLRTVQLEPQVLLLDEPTAACDPERTAAMEEFLTAWVAQAPGQRALVWATHDALQVSRVATGVCSVTT